MKINKIELQRLYKETIASGRTAGQSECASLDQIVRFFERRLSKKARRRLVDHVTGCPTCCQEFEFLLELQRFEKEIARQAVELEESRFRSRPRLKTRANFLFQHAAGLVVVFFLLSSLALMWRGANQAVDRGRKTSAVVLFQPAGSVVGQSVLEFSWQASVPSLEYIVELFDDALKPIWKSERLAASKVLLPEKILALLRPGETYYWMVTAYAGGRYHDESDFQAFSLLRK